MGEEIKSEQDGQDEKDWERGYITRAITRKMDVAARSVLRDEAVS